MRDRLPAWRTVLVLLAIAAAGCHRAPTFPEPPPPRMVHVGDFPERFRVLFGGDTSFGESYGRDVMAVLNGRGYAFCLERLRPLMTASDFVVLNLETPITDLKSSPYDGKKEYVHWTDVEKTPRELIAHGVKLVSLANNHTLDYGMDGLVQTFRVLTKAGIPWIGAGVTERSARDPFLGAASVGGRPFRFAILAGFEYSRSYDAKYDQYADGQDGGAARLDAEKTAAQIRDLHAAYPGIYVIVFPHWGANYAWKNKAQTKMARALVDAGADLVIGHGGHLMQEIDHVGDRRVVYGIGNFMFNSEGRFKKLQGHPFGMPVQLVLQPGPTGLTKLLRAYPIFSNNRITGYQPRPVTPEEFEQAATLLREHADDPARFDAEVKRGSDAFGSYLETAL
jgi:poly-gamma-glutamate capsule biosynthesis protein CapA/YwtB (metallophosphatase superfamily)